MPRRHLILAFVIAVAGLPVSGQDLAAAVSTAAHAACRVANDQVKAMFPGLQQTWSDNGSAQRLLAEAQDRLHLASAPLQNSDCGGAGLGTPRCAELDAAYRTAREEVLLVDGAARSSARTYAINLARYQTAASAATRLCATAAAADAARARGAIGDSDLVALIQELLAQANALIAALDPSVDAGVAVPVAPTPPVEAVVTVPPPPTDPTTPPPPPEVTVAGATEASLTWMWEFNAITFNGSYTGDFGTSFTFTGTSLPGLVDVIGTARCTGQNVPTEGWDGGAIEMSCDASWPASGAHGPLTWHATGGGLANYDGFLVKGGGTGTFTDDSGGHDKAAEVLSIRPGLATP